MKWILLGVSSLGVITLVLALSLTLGLRNTEEVFVETDVGTIRGLVAEDGDYSMFMGIPYAVVNRSNPFGPSAPSPNFEEVFNAFDDSAICPQVEEFNNTIVGTLDCLHLNIYVPNSASSTNKLPVLVWIYGGGFSIGFAGRYVYGPKYLVRHDIILVTLNYRLGPYGFMCLDIPEVPGNQGLRDQLLALKWINNNIAAFNGDETKITVMGNSAGAVSIEVFIRSYHEKLYNQVILQSGSVFIPSIVVPSDPTLPLRIAAHLNFLTQDLNAAIDFLAGVDTDLVIAASRDMNIAYRVCDEKYFDSESINTTHTEFLVQNARDLKVLTGFTSHEQMVSYVTAPPEDFEGSRIFHQYLQRIFDIENDFEEMTDIMKRFYIGGRQISQDVKWEISDFSSDVIYNHGIQRSLRQLLENDAIVYQYVFSYSGDRNFVKMRRNVTEHGAAHADEVGYLFDIVLANENPNTQDQLIIDRMTTIWANFAKYGDPTPEENDLLPIKWHPTTKDRGYYMDIDTDLTLGSSPYHERLTFWDLFYIANADKRIGLYLN